MCYKHLVRIDTHEIISSNKLEPVRHQISSPLAHTFPNPLFDAADLFVVALRGVWRWLSVCDVVTGVTSLIGAKSISKSELKRMENLASKMSIQFSQFGAGNPKPRYESSIGVEIEKMSVETLALGSRNCDNDHELEKVEVSHKAFDEMPKLNLGVGHKVFDELPNGNVNPTSGGWFRELNGLKQISSAKEYHKTFCSILDGSKVSPEYNLSCFIDGLKEEIQGMATLQYGAHTVQGKDVGKAENDNDIENMVFEDVKEEKDIVAQKYTRLLWDISEMQDLCRSLEVKKDSEDGQKDLSLLGEIESIEGMEKTDIEMLNKHKKKGEINQYYDFC
ncbi:hypothetical protein Tco_1130321 [Tanacetum coccineum]